MASKKPRYLKVLAGTDRPGRTAQDEPHFPPLDQVPSAPDFLPSGHATREWNRLASLMVQHGLLTQGNLPALALACGLFGRIVQFWGAGRAPQASFVAQYRGLLADLGLSRIGPPELPAKPNPF